jgi:cobalamin synthase
MVLNHTRNMIIIVLATCISLYLFPKQDSFWAYLSVTYYVSVCGMLVALFLTLQHLRKWVNYISMTDFEAKNCFVVIFYASIPLLLFLFLPIHTVIFFFWFVCYQWREWKKHRNVILLEKKQPIKQK